MPPTPSSSSTSSLQVSLVNSSMHLAGSNGNIAIDSHGNIFYPDINGWVIRKIDTLGNQTVFAGNGIDAYIDGTGTGASFYAPYLVTIDRNDNLYVADGVAIRKINPTGIVTTIVSNIGTALPYGIAADSSGNVYFVNGFATSAHVIQKSTPGGVISTFAGSGVAGSADGTGTAAEFNSPRDLVVDSSDNIFVADTGNHLIRKISPAGLVSTFAGNGAQSIQNGIGRDASFYFYDSYGHIAIDHSDNIFVGDMTGIDSNRNDTIRKISPDGTVSTYCGKGNSTLATGACSDISAISRFGVGIAPDGTVYFVDTDGLYKISQQMQ